MIIRKPYAFLIKNFKKIHIVLLLLSLYVAYKLFDVSKFIGEFMNYGIYDAYQNPVTDHITFLLQIVLLLIFAGSLALMFLLQHKGKPWKIYLIPVVEYIVLLFVLNMIKSFFTGYTNSVETTDLRLSRDLLMIFVIAQLPAIFIFVMRVFGLDIKKFNFNSDQEFLELSEEDREEMEISLDIDRNSFIRFFRKFRRNVGYFYEEHKNICKALLLLLIIIVGFSSYKYIFVTNKSYNEGDFYSANGYTIQINHSYFTDKDYTGNVIADKSNFVVVDLTIKNHEAPRTIKLDNFHVKNGVSDFISSGKTYEKEFQDLGDAYDSVKELKRDEAVDLIIIFKVNKELKKNNFSLFYQENGGKLRKIKLKLEDVSKIKDMGSIELEKEIDFNIKGVKQTLSFDDYDILESIDYKYRTCISSGCELKDGTFKASSGNKLLNIWFGSNYFEGKDMVDFSIDYGKIVYIDNNNMEQFAEFKYPLKNVAQGKRIISLISDEVANSSRLELQYVIRDKKYTFKLK